MSKIKTKMYLDLLLFGALVIVSMPKFTGITVHEWLAVAFIPVIVIHVILNWQWVINITKRLFINLKGEIRFNYVLNTLLFILMVTVMFSDILISKEVLPSLGIAVQPAAYWRGLHNMSANLLILTVGVHVAMHWRWIVNTTNRYLFKRDTQNGLAVLGGNQS